jgi:hypothetical protein
LVDLVAAGKLAAGDQPEVVVAVELSPAHGKYTSLPP